MGRVSPLEDAAFGEKENQVGTRSWFYSTLHTQLQLRTLEIGVPWWEWHCEQEFMFWTSATPGKNIRKVVFSGMKWDVETVRLIKVRRSEMEIMSSIIITKQDEALAMHEAMKATKKNKENKAPAKNKVTE